jgi:hypothetical protein
LFFAEAALSERVEAEVQHLLGSASKIKRREDIYEQSLFPQ